MEQDDSSTQFPMTKSAASNRRGNEWILKLIKSTSGAALKNEFVKS